MPKKAVILTNQDVLHFPEMVQRLDCSSSSLLPFFPFMNDYWIDVAFFVGIYSLLGLSLNIVLGEVGLFDLGHTAFYAIGAYTTAILNTQFNIPILLLLP